MELKTLLVERDGPLLWITLNRPHRLNAWTGRMHTEYRHVMAQADADPEVGAMVVTGAGRGFCAGGDSEALAGHVERGGYDPGTPPEIARPGWGVRPEFDADFAWHFGLSKPVVAAVNGPAAGVGMVLACFCDIRYAAAGAVLTPAHGRLGLPAEYGLSWLLPRLVGLGRAQEWLLSSRRVEAEEARAMGLVQEVFPPEALRDEVARRVRTLVTEVSPESLRVTRWQVYADLHRDVASAVRHAQEKLEAMMRGPDFREGVAALRERRPPAFRPRPVSGPTRD